MEPVVPRLAVSAGIWHLGRLLLVLRSRPPMAGLWTFPGGHVEAGETLAEAVRREVAEETGLVVETVGEPMLHEIILRDPAGALTAHRVLVVFAGRVVGETREPVAASDAAAARFEIPGEIGRLATTPGLARFVEGTAARVGSAALPP